MANVEKNIYCSDSYLVSSVQPETFPNYNENVDTLASSL